MCINALASYLVILSGFHFLVCSIGFLNMGVSNTLDFLLVQWASYYIYLYKYVQLFSWHHILITVDHDSAVHSVSHSLEVLPVSFHTVIEFCVLTVILFQSFQRGSGTTVEQCGPRVSNMWLLILLLG